MNFQALKNKVIQTRPESPFPPGMLPVRSDSPATSQLAALRNKHPNKFTRIGQDAAPITRQVTGSIIGDALVGGVLGYALARDQSRLPAAAVGAVSTGLAGVLGLLITTGYLVVVNRPGQ